MHLSMTVLSRCLVKKSLAFKILFDFHNFQGAVVHKLLNSELCGIQMSYLSKTASRGNGLASGGIREQTNPHMHTQVSQ